MRGSFSLLCASEIYDGVIRCSFQSANATIAAYIFRPGAQFPIHHHPQEQITLVEEGDIEMTIGDQVESLVAGDFAIVEPSVQHGIRAGQHGARVVAVVTPPRQTSDEYTVVRRGD